MKKFRMVLAIALIATICAVFLTACGSNYSGDPEKDKKTLEDKGFQVIMTEIDGVTCLNALKSNIKFEDINEDNINDLKIESVAIAYYKDNDAAKQAYDKHMKELEEQGEVIRQKFTIDGNMIIAEIELTGREAFEFM